MLFRGAAWLWLFFATAVSSLAAPHPNVILITIDTARADRMGFLGSTLGLTPHLDALAAHAIIFTHAYAQAPLTTVSHGTILTGTYPQYHQVKDAGVPLAQSLPFAPEIFRKNRYQTAAFVGAVILDPSAGAPGFDRGFDHYDAGFHARQPGEDRYASLERRAGDVEARAEVWLRQHMRGQFFLWMHFYDPHAPYDPPQPYRSRFAAQPYDGEIAYVDAVLGKFFDQLHRDAAFDNSVIAIMADHGEGLGEHGERGHGIFLYDETIHVPLLIKPAGPPRAPKQVEAKVELADVLPTLVASAGLSIPPAIQGVSLLPLMDGRPDMDKSRAAAYAETDYPHRAYGWSPLRSWREEKYLAVEAPRPELYDLAGDLACQHNLASSSKAVLDTLAENLNRFRERTSSSRSAARTKIDAQQEAKLQALGYVAGASATANQDAVGGIDPKDKIELADLMTEASLDLEEGRAPSAIQILQEVVRQDQTIAAAYATLGSALLATGNVSQAVPILRKAVELRPQSTLAHYQLGSALFQLGDLKPAASEYETAVAQDPDSADMRYSLASIYVRLDRFADAKAQLQKSLALRPQHYLANVMLGQIDLMEKNPAAALKFLLTAATAQPARPEAHALLADAYERLGEKAKASQQRALAEKARPR